MKLAISYLDLSKLLGTNVSSKDKNEKKFFSPQDSFTWNSVKAKKKLFFPLNLNNCRREESQKERTCYEVYLRTQNLEAKSKANNFKLKFRKKITLNKSQNFSYPLILKGCVCYIFASLVFKSKREHLSNWEKCFLFSFKSSFYSRENQILVI